MDGFDLLQRARMSADGADMSTSGESFALAAQEYSRSSLAPILKAFNAEVLAARGSIDEACQVMQETIATLPKAHPLYFLYATKYALMCMDAASEQVRGEGLALLQNLAGAHTDEKHQWNYNPYRDEALFYLGLHFYAQNLRDEAKKYWTQMLRESQGKSLWIPRAKRYMQLIIE